MPRYRPELNQVDWATVAKMRAEGKPLGECARYIKEKHGVLFNTGTIFNRIKRFNKEHSTTQTEDSNPRTPEPTAPLKEEEVSANTEAASTDIPKAHTPPPEAAPVAEKSPVTPVETQPTIASEVSVLDRLFKASEEIDAQHERPQKSRGKGNVYFGNWSDKIFSSENLKTVITVALPLLALLLILNYIRNRNKEQEKKAQEPTKPTIPSDASPTTRAFLESQK